MSTLKDEIASIIEDRIHGSSELLDHVITTINTHEDVGISQLREVLNELRQVDPSMIIVHHFLNSMEKVKEADLRDEIRRYRSTWSNVNDRIYHKLTSQFNLEDCTILTHSRSGTVLDVLLRKNDKIRIIQTISRPGKEGRLQAEDLKKSGIEVELIEDHEVDRELKKVDLCLFGCDQYSEDAFINKIGTAAIIENAVLHNIPIVVLTDSRKKVDVLTNVNSLFETISITRNVELITEL